MKIKTMNKRSDSITNPFLQSPMSRLLKNLSLRLVRRILTKKIQRTSTTSQLILNSKSKWRARKILKTLM